MKNSKLLFILLLGIIIVSCNYNSDDIKNTYTISGKVNNVVIVSFLPNNEIHFDTLHFDINLISNDQIIATSNDATFSIPDLEEGKSYTVVPKSAEKGLYGTTAIDFVIIRKFIEGSEQLDALGEIAADVNQDNIINQTDLDLISNCLLNHECPASIRFVTEDYDGHGNGFVDQFSVSKLSSDVKINFIPVRMGDVNRSL